MNDTSSPVVLEFLAKDKRAKVERILLRASEDSYPPVAKLAKNALESQSLMTKAFGVALYTPLIEKPEYREAALKAAETTVDNSHQFVIQANLYLFSSLVRRDLGFELALQTASKHFSSPDQDISGAASQILNALINKNYEINAVIQLATSAALNHNILVQEQGFGLLRDLVNQDKNGATESAITAINPLIDNPDSTIGRSALDLCLELFRKGSLAANKMHLVFKKAIESTDDNSKHYALQQLNNYSNQYNQVANLFSEQEILKIATSSISSENTQIRDIGLSLLNQLIQKNITISDDIIDTIKKLSLNPNATFISSLSGLLRNLASKDLFSNQELLQTAIAWTSNSDSFIQGEGLSLFSELAERDIGTPEALGVIEKFANNSNSNIVFSLSRLLTTLMSKDKIPTETAVQAATQWIKSSNPYIQGRGLSLLSKLVEKDVGVSEAVDAIKQLSSNPNSNFASELKNLLTILTSKKHFSEQDALQIATQWLKSSDSNIQNQGLSLLNQLAQNNIGISEALDAIKQFSSDTNSNLTYEVNQLLVTLVSQDKLPSQDAIQITNQYLQNSDANTQRQGLSLLNQLAQKDVKIPEALETIMPFIKNNNPSLTYDLGQLLDSLVSKNQFSDEEALQITTQWIDSSDPSTQSRGLSLLNKLTAKEVGIPEAIKAVERFRNSTDDGIISNVSNLLENSKILTELPEKVVLGIATQWTKNTDFYTQDRGLSLFAKLAQNDIGIPEAIEAVKHSESTQSEAESYNLLNLTDILVAKELLELELAFSIASRGLQSQYNKWKVLYIFEKLVERKFKLPEIKALIEEAQLKPGFTDNYTADRIIRQINEAELKL
ncbi:MAG: hypothetical protein JKY15_01355 [Deltaproteobacteria bacterium]|nr:hypothetical protein [Deltaproteobacteria bacterium]